MNDIEQRIMNLEARLALVERTISISPQESDSNIPSTTNETESGRCYSFLKVDISNKRYDPANTSIGTYEDHIWFDCLYTPTGLSKATRAIKGLLEFADHFGDVIFLINVTINEVINPGRPLSQKGIGFTYNQFMQPHQWLLSTKVSDMKCALRITNILYVDGNTEVFS